MGRSDSTVATCPRAVRNKNPCGHRYARDINTGVQRLGKGMVAKHHVVLASFLVQPDGLTGPFGSEILNPHLQRRADPRKGVSEGSDQRPVAKVAHGFGWGGVE